MATNQAHVSIVVPPSSEKLAPAVNAILEPSTHERPHVPALVVLNVSCDSFITSQISSLRAVCTTNQAYLCAEGAGLALIAQNNTPTDPLDCACMADMLLVDPASWFGFDDCAVVAIQRLPQAASPSFISMPHHVFTMPQSFIVPFRHREELCFNTRNEFGEVEYPDDFDSDEEYKAEWMRTLAPLVKLWTVLSRIGSPQMRIMIDGVTTLAESFVHLLHDASNLHITYEGVACVVRISYALPRDERSISRDAARKQISSANAALYAGVEERAAVLNVLCGHGEHGVFLHFSPSRLLARGAIALPDGAAVRALSGALRDAADRYDMCRVASHAFEARVARCADVQLVLQDEFSPELALTFACFRVVPASVRTSWRECDHTVRVVSHLTSTLAVTLSEAPELAYSGAHLDDNMAPARRHVEGFMETGRNSPLIRSPPLMRCTIVNDEVDEQTEGRRYEELPYAFFLHSQLGSMVPDFLSVEPRIALAPVDAVRHAYAAAELVVKAVQDAMTNYNCEGVPVEGVDNYDALGQSCARMLRSKGSRFHCTPSIQESLEIEESHGNFEGDSLMKGVDTLGHANNPWTQHCGQKSAMQQDDIPGRDSEVQSDGEGFESAVSGEVESAGNGPLRSLKSADGKRYSTDEVDDRVATGKNVTDEKKQQGFDEDNGNGSPSTIKQSDTTQYNHTKVTSRNQEHTAESTETGTGANVCPNDTSTTSSAPRSWFGFFSLSSRLSSTKGETVCSAGHDHRRSNLDAQDFDRCTSTDEVEDFKTAEHSKTTKIPSTASTLSPSSTIGTNVSPTSMASEELRKLSAVSNSCEEDAQTTISLRGTEKRAPQRSKASSMKSKTRSLLLNIIDPFLGGPPCDSDASASSEEDTGLVRSAALKSKSNANEDEQVRDLDETSTGGSDGLRARSSTTGSLHFSGTSSTSPCGIQADKPSCPSMNISKSRKFTYLAKGYLGDNSIVGGSTDVMALQCSTTSKSSEEDKASVWNMEKQVPNSSRVEGTDAVRHASDSSRYFSPLDSSTCKTSTSPKIGATSLSVTDDLGSNGDNDCRIESANSSKDTPYRFTDALSVSRFLKYVFGFSHSSPSRPSRYEAEKDGVSNCNSVDIADVPESSHPSSIGSLAPVSRTSMDRSTQSELRTHSSVLVSRYQVRNDGKHVSGSHAILGESNISHGHFRSSCHSSTKESSFQLSPGRGSFTHDGDGQLSSDDSIEGGYVTMESYASSDIADVPMTLSSNGMTLGQIQEQGNEDDYAGMSSTSSDFQGESMDHRKQTELPSLGGLSSRKRRSGGRQTSRKSGYQAGLRGAVEVEHSNLGGSPPKYVRSSKSPRALSTQRSSPPIRSMSCVKNSLLERSTLEQPRNRGKMPRIFESDETDATSAPSTFVSLSRSSRSQVGTSTLKTRSNFKKTAGSREARPTSRTCSRGHVTEQMSGYSAGLEGSFEGEGDSELLDSIMMSHPYSSSMRYTSSKVCATSAQTTSHMKNSATLSPSKKGSSCRISRHQAERYRESSDISILETSEGISHSYASGSKVRGHASKETSSHPNFPRPKTAERLPESECSSGQNSSTEAYQLSADYESRTESDIVSDFDGPEGNASKGIQGYLLLNSKHEAKSKLAREPSIGYERFSEASARDVTHSARRSTISRILNGTQGTESLKTPTVDGTLPSVVLEQPRSLNGREPLQVKKSAVIEKERNGDMSAEATREKNAMTSVGITQDWTGLRSWFGRTDRGVLQENEVETNSEGASMTSWFHVTGKPVTREEEGTESSSTLSWFRPEGGPRTTRVVMESADRNTERRSAHTHSDSGSEEFSGDRDSQFSEEESELHNDYGAEDVSGDDAGENFEGEVEHTGGHENTSSSDIYEEEESIDGTQQSGRSRSAELSSDSEEENMADMTSRHGATRILGWMRRRPAQSANMSTVTDEVMYTDLKHVRKENRGFLGTSNNGSNDQTIVSPSIGRGVLDQLDERKKRAGNPDEDDDNFDGFSNLNHSDTSTSSGSDSYSDSEESFISDIRVRSRDHIEGDLVSRDRRCGDNLRKEPSTRERNREHRLERGASLSRFEEMSVSDTLDRFDVGIDDERSSQDSDASYSTEGSKYDSQSDGRGSIGSRTNSAGMASDAGFEHHESDTGSLSDSSTLPSSMQTGSAESTVRTSKAGRSGTNGWWNFGWWRGGNVSGKKHGEGSQMALRALDNTSGDGDETLSSENEEGGLEGVSDRGGDLGNSASDSESVTNNGTVSDLGSGSESGEESDSANTRTGSGSETMSESTRVEDEPIDVVEGWSRSMSTDTAEMTSEAVSGGGFEIESENESNSASESESAHGESESEGSEREESASEESASEESASEDTPGDQSVSDISRKAMSKNNESEGDGSGSDKDGTSVGESDVSEESGSENYENRVDVGASMKEVMMGGEAKGEGERKKDEGRVLSNETLRRTGGRGYLSWMRRWT